MNVEAFVNQACARCIGPSGHGGEHEHLEIACDDHIAIPDRFGPARQAQTPLHDHRDPLEKFRIARATKIDRIDTFDAIDDRVVAMKADEHDSIAKSAQHLHALANGGIGQIMDEISDTQFTIPLRLLDSDLAVRCEKRLRVFPNATSGNPGEHKNETDRSAENYCQKLQPRAPRR
jgi:hypothetical protein